MRRFIRREHKPARFGKTTIIGVANGVWWTACIALPAIIDQYVDVSLSMSL